MSFLVGISREYLARGGRAIWAGLCDDPLESEPGLAFEFLPEGLSPTAAEVLRRYDAVISGGVRYTDESFAGVERLALIARFGVGYDTIDLQATTRAGIAVTITKGAADRPVAEGALTMMLALSHHVVMKDRLTREGRWAERHHWPGTELRDRVVGILGFGGIGSELARLLKVFRPASILACDPYMDTETARELGVEPVSFETLLRASDFLSIHCPLIPETRGMINTHALSLMKPTAFLINTARGPVVDQAALTAALQNGTLRGAALDVFTKEPIDADDPLLSLDNVILAPHAIATTEEMYRDYYRSCAAAILSVKRGALPDHVVNPQVVGTPTFEEKIQRLRT